MNEPKCNCQTRIRDEIKCEPSAGHDYVDEVLGLLRVIRGQRDDAERRLQAEIVGANIRPLATIYKHKMKIPKSSALYKGSARNKAHAARFFRFRLYQ